MAVSSCRLPEHGKLCFKSVKVSENNNKSFFDSTFSQLSHDTKHYGANCIIFAPQ